MAKRINWTKTAAKSRRDTIKFWKKRNSSNQYPHFLSKTFINTTLLLSHYNNLGKSTDFKDVRAIIIHNFSIFYKVKTDHILVVGLWDSRRNPDKMKENIELKS